MAVELTATISPQATAGAGGVPEGENQRKQREGDRYLKNASQQGAGPQALQPPEGKLEADAEKQKRDPQLTPVGKGLTVEQRRPEDGSGEQIADDRALLQTPGAGAEHEGNGQEQHQFCESLPHDHLRTRSADRRP